MTDDGPRYRHPGSPGHASAAVWLWQQMDVPGWQRSWQNFTGTEYQNLSKGSVAGYTHAPFCTEPDRSELPTLPFHNLVATLPGDNRTLLLAAHWDSKEDGHGGPMLGANDGASGVGVLLQLMRHMDTVQPNYTVIVTFFDGEDGFEDCHPLAGSIYFAEHGPRVDRMILLDMVGDPDARFIRESGGVRTDPELLDALWHYGKTLRPDNFIDRERSVLDDHTPFLDRGGRAIDIIDYGRSSNGGFPPYWHTHEDTMDNIDASMLGDVGQVLLDVMREPVLTGAWPTP